MDLNTAQQAAVETPGSLRILAAPGSGKTRVLTQRILHLISGGVHPREILAITFTRAAAKEMRTRLEAFLGDGIKSMQISTFHALSLRVVRKWGFLLGYRPGLSVYDERDQLDIITHVAKDMNIKKPSPEKILEDLELPKHADIKSEYRDRVRGSNAMDYDMLIEEATKLLAMDRVRDDFSYKHVLIDEFQDVNSDQYAMACSIAQNRCDLFAVLDVDQAIMEFQGASVEFAIRLPDDFPGMKTVFLDTCYRCPANVLDAANKLILNNSTRLDKPCRTDNPPGEIKSVVLDNEQEEAVWIARKCKQLHDDGIRFSEMAILCRTHRLKNVLLTDLKVAGLPVNVCGRTQEFFRQPAVLDYISYLRAITNPFDTFSFRRTLSLPDKGLTWSEIMRCETTARKASVECLAGAEIFFNNSKSRNEKVSAFLGQMRTWQEMAKDPKNHEKVVSEVGSMLSEAHMAQGLTGRAGEVREAAMRYTMLAFGFSSIQEFIEYVVESDGQDDLISKIDVDKPDQVNIMTCHIAKGLEFKAVFIPGVEMGVFPTASAIKDEEEMEQERRLFYVAITRSESSLYLTRCTQRTMWAGPETNDASLFLEELDLDSSKGVTF